MATQILTVASFDDGAAIVRVAYDDVSGGVLGFRAVITRELLTATFSRQNGQSRSYTLGVGTHQTANVPPNVQIGADPDTGEPTITRGNAILTLAWSDQ